ncbi:hypothetical protein [Methylocapsa aurea]|uniref:hypothetical protein n=1 Tax=Methylocapsa aurea TaxID=663610 RepID=UPI003D18B7F2
MGQDGVRRCGWLIIALIAFQGVVLGAMASCRLSPVELGVRDSGAVDTPQCDSPARAHHAPFEHGVPSEYCCISCAAGSCGPNSSSLVDAGAEYLERLSLRAFSIGGSTWVDPLERHPVGWSTSWSSRAPPFFS